MQMGEFKQEVLRINNKVNMELFKQGLLSQRINVFRNEVVITAKNRRLNALAFAALDKQTTATMDRALIICYKRVFIDTIEPDLEISASVTIFEKNIDELLPELHLRTPAP